MITEPRTITIRLVCRSLPPVPPEEEPIVVGMQDKDQQVYPGETQSDGSTVYHCELTVKRDKITQQPVFSGAFAQGAPVNRFLYVSWKRVKNTDNLWLQRIKVPLKDISWEMIEGVEVLEADITHRRPHLTQPVNWTADYTPKFSL